MLELILYSFNAFPVCFYVKNCEEMIYINVNEQTVILLKFFLVIKIFLELYH